MLPTNDTIIFIFFVLIFCGSMGYYINRVVTYKNDERGISILAKASMITFSSILLLFDKQSSDLKEYIKNYVKQSKIFTEAEKQQLNK